MAFTPITAVELADPAALNSRLESIEAIIGGGSSFPAAQMLLYGGSSAPTGWLLCNGAAVSRATYATLFAEIGTTFGVGDGSTTFNVPDMRGRIPIGAGTGTGLSARTLGQQVGAETHQLTESEMAAHTHSGSTTTPTTGLGAASSNQSNQDSVTGSEGSDQAHNNIQPSRGLNFIIKV